MLRSRAFRKLAFVGVLVSATPYLGQSKPVQACNILLCPEYWSWTGCRCLCVCMTEECCRYYGFCNPAGDC